MVAHRGDAALGQSAAAGAVDRPVCGRRARGQSAAGRAADRSSTAPEESLERLGVGHGAGPVIVVEVDIPGATAGKVGQAIDP